jgi:hypothetical protein
LLVNPSFESGDHGWKLAKALSTAEFAPAEAAPGRMLKLEGLTGVSTATQDVEIPAAWVGHTMTLSFLGKMEGDGFLAPFVAGAGIDLGQGSFRIESGGGWCLAAVSFQPRNRGVLRVGAWIVGKNSAKASLDEFRLAFGAESVPAGAQVQELQLGETTFTTGSGPPRDGSWRVGDLVVNKHPSAGEPLLWRAIEAGSPGVWEAVAPSIGGSQELEAERLEPHTCTDSVFPLPGARTGQTCSSGLFPVPPGNVVSACYVVRNDAVMLRLCNSGVAAVQMPDAKAIVRVGSF